MDINNEKLYWVWLSLIFPAGSDKPNEILMSVESPVEFYNMAAEEMNKFCFLTEKDVKQIKTVSLERAQLVIDRCEQFKIDIVTYQDELYPAKLKLIYGPPIVLYVQGNIEGINDEVCITIVGTRKCTDYTAYATEFMAYHLVKAGAIIISGCAVGIDSCAHRGALKAGGRTIGVLACGHDIDYPFESHDMKREMLENGALISELPPGTTVTPKIFPVRNRLMAGLALGVFVTHAPERSGSLITVEHAIEQGKDVFCLPPHNIFDAQYAGVIKYIRDGATPVFSAKDILIEYYGSHSHKLNVDKIIGNYLHQKQMENRPQKEKPTKKEPQEQPVLKPEISEQEIREKNKDLQNELTEEQKFVYDNLTNEPMFIDEISSRCQMDVGVVLSVLTELEIIGVAGSFSGRRYALI